VSPWYGPNVAAVIAIASVFWAGFEPFRIFFPPTCSLANKKYINLSQFLYLPRDQNCFSCTFVRLSYGELQIAHRNGHCSGCYRISELTLVCNITVDRQMCYVERSYRLRSCLSCFSLFPVLRIGHISCTDKSNIEWYDIAWTRRQYELNEHTRV
jgi:hypothetical protein